MKKYFELIIQTPTGSTVILDGIPSYPVAKSLIRKRRDPVGTRIDFCFSGDVLVSWERGSSGWKIIFMELYSSERVGGAPVSSHKAARARRDSVAYFEAA